MNSRALIAIAIATPALVVAVTILVIACLVCPADEANAVEAALDGLSGIEWLGLGLIGWLLVICLSWVIA